MRSRSDFTPNTQGIYSHMRRWKQRFKPPLYAHIPNHIIFNKLDPIISHNRNFLEKVFKINAIFYHCENMCTFSIAAILRPIHAVYTTIYPAYFKRLKTP